MQYYKTIILQLKINEFKKDTSQIGLEPVVMTFFVFLNLVAFFFLLHVVFQVYPKVTQLYIYIYIHSFSDSFLI